jgi:hypothetical protein
MGDVVKDLQRFSFDGVEFAVLRYSITGGLRTHTHEFRHTPGGHIEKLGRKLYQVSVEAIHSVNSRLYPNALTTEAEIRLKGETETTGPLVIPHIGTFQAVCTDWPVDVDFRMRRDGLTSRYTFLEDQQTAFLVESSVTVNAGGIVPKADAIVEECEVAGVDPDLFSSILALATQIQALGSQIDEAGASYIDKIGALISACQIVYDTFDIFADPANHRVGAAVRDLCVAAISLQQDVLRKGRPIIDHEVTFTQSVSDVSVALYNSTLGAMDIMKMNPIEDAMAIPPGTTLRVYAYL